MVELGIIFGCLLVCFTAVFANRGKFKPDVTISDRPPERFIDSAQVIRLPTVRDPVKVTASARGQLIEFNPKTTQTKGK